MKERILDAADPSTRTDGQVDVIRRAFLLKLSAKSTSILPGVGITSAIAGAAFIASHFLPAIVSPVLIAVSLGIAVGNSWQLPEDTRAGITFLAKRVLRWGVALLGSKLFLTDIVGVGVVSLFVVVGSMTVAFATVLLVSRVSRVSPTLAILLAVGTAVCGNSAIIAAAPIIDAEERDIGAAVATITIFGTIALLVLPILGHLLSLSNEFFGFWVGISVHDTSQVVAASASFSESALEVATVVKLVRNSLMAPLLLMLFWWSTRRRRNPTTDASASGTARSAFPSFVLAFIVLAGLRSVGVVGDGLASILSTASTMLIVLAISAVGLSTRFAELRHVGARPFIVGMSAALVLGLTGFGLATIAVT